MPTSRKWFLPPPLPTFKFHPAPTPQPFKVYPGAHIPSTYDDDIFQFSGWYNVDGRLPEDEDIIQPEPSEFKLRVSSALLEKTPMDWGRVQNWLEAHAWDVRLKAHMDEFYTDVFFKTRELYLEFVDKFPGFLQGS